MNHKFPIINHIDEVLPHLDDGFIVVKKPGYTVINYVMMGNTTFPDVIENDYGAAVRRECRGLIFDAEGRIASRAYHKFFNLDERVETSFANVNFSEPHVILEKLDGSMIRPIRFGNRFRLATKMGITDIAMMAEQFIAKNPIYIKFIDFVMNNGQTPIFEFCSRRNRIVVDYPTDRLVLTAIRDNITGDYLSYDDLVKLPFDMIDTVKAYDGSAKSMEHLVRTIRDQDEGEGWVVRFNSGHMLKIKSENYIRLHRAKSDIDAEHKVVSVIMNEQLDDILSILDADTRDRLIAFADSLSGGFRSAVTDIVAALAIADERGADRKTIALEIVPTFDKVLHSVIFRMIGMEGDRRVIATDLLKDLVLRRSNTARNWAETKAYFLGEISWNSVDINE